MKPPELSLRENSHLPPVIQGLCLCLRMENTHNQAVFITVFNDIGLCCAILFSEFWPIFNLWQPKPSR
jgi:hypothetical protein